MSAYILTIPDTEMVAMSRDTYINVDQSELKQCIKFPIMYFCEQTFLMKHTSEHTCEMAIYHEQSPHIIKDKCNIQYFPEVPNPTNLRCSKTYFVRKYSRTMVSTMSQE